MQIPLQGGGGGQLSVFGAFELRFMTLSRKLAILDRFAKGSDKSAPLLVRVRAALLRGRGACAPRTGAMEHSEEKVNSECLKGVFKCG